MNRWSKKKSQTRILTSIPSRSSGNGSFSCPAHSATSIARADPKNHPRSLGLSRRSDEKRPGEDGDADGNLHTFPVNVPEKIKELFVEMEVSDACFFRDSDAKGGHHVLITVPLAREFADKVVEKLIELGIGVHYGNVSHAPLNILRTAKSTDPLSQLVRALERGPARRLLPEIRSLSHKLTGSTRDGKSCP